jgi:hypothetical protein
LNLFERAADFWFHRSNLSMRSQVENQENQHVSLRENG